MFRFCTSLLVIGTVLAYNGNAQLPTPATTFEKRVRKRQTPVNSPILPKISSPPTPPALPESGVPRLPIPIASQVLEISRTTYTMPNISPSPTIVGQLDHKPSNPFPVSALGQWTEDWVHPEDFEDLAAKADPIVKVITRSMQSLEQLVPWLSDVEEVHPDFSPADEWAGDWAPEADFTEIDMDGSISGPRLARRQVASSSPTLPKISPPPTPLGLPKSEIPRLPIPVSTLGSSPV